MCYVEIISCLCGMLNSSPVSAFPLPDVSVMNMPGYWTSWKRTLYALIDTFFIF